MELRSRPFAQARGLTARVGVILIVLALGTPGAWARDIARVPAGPFIMGRDDGPADERPAHRVDLPGFDIDIREVTNAEFAEFLNAVGTHNARGERLYDDDDGDARIHRVDARFRADPGFEAMPVVEASWPGARDYCAWRGKRLPSEAEWEKAARGDDARRYPWGEAAADATRARFGAGWRDYAPVGAHRAGASPFGVLDMAGNVWEWVASAYRPYPYRADDGREDLAAGPVRGTRGGGQDSPAARITTTERGRDLSRGQGAGHHDIGFRCARSLG